MTTQEIEAKIVELKGKQSEFFKKKKSDRNQEELDAVRKELNELKQEVKAQYRK